MKRLLAILALGAALAGALAPGVAASASVEATTPMVAVCPTFNDSACGSKRIFADWVPAAAAVSAAPTGAPGTGAAGVTF